MTAADRSDAKPFQFMVALFGGRLATIRVPVPITKRNLERLQRMIGEQLEPLLQEDEPEHPAPCPRTEHEEEVG